jgi:hypothetical protein
MLRKIDTVNHISIKYYTKYRFPKFIKIYPVKNYHC